MSKLLAEHPFKEGVRNLLRKHFTDSIAERFVLILEAEIFQGKNIKKQLTDDKIIMEVHFSNGITTEYICDVYGWQEKAATEARLLRYITDAIRAGKIGKDWIEVKGKISDDIRSGKFETPDELLN